MISATRPQMIMMSAAGQCSILNKAPAITMAAKKLNKKFMTDWPRLVLKKSIGKTFKLI
jgi:hypothetical protein